MTTPESNSSKVAKRPPPPVPSRHGTKFGLPKHSNSEQTTALTEPLPSIHLSSLSNSNNNNHALQSPVTPTTPISPNVLSSPLSSPLSANSKNQKSVKGSNLKKEKSVSELAVSSLRGAIQDSKIEGTENLFKFDKFEIQFKIAQEQEKELPDLFELNQYDIQIEEIQRKDLNLDQIHFFEKVLTDPKLSYYAKESILFFVQPYKTVKGSYFDQSLDQSTANSQRRNRRTKILTPSEANAVSNKIERSISTSEISGPAKTTSLETILHKRLALLKEEEELNKKNNDNTDNNNNKNVSQSPKKIKNADNSHHQAPKVNKLLKKEHLNVNPNASKRRGSLKVPNTKYDENDVFSKPEVKGRRIKDRNILNADLEFDFKLLSHTEEERMKLIKSTIIEHTPKELFLEIDHHEKNRPSSLNTPPFFYKTSKRLKIELRELSLPVDEPFYCTISLHDIKQKARVSELFYFELFSSDKNNLSKAKNPITSSKECFIPIHSENISDLTVIVRIQKLFKGDIEKDILLYTKAAKKAQFEKTKPLDSKEITEDPGLNLQPFLWAYVNLIDEAGKFRTGDISLDEFRPIRTLCGDEYIYEQMYREFEGKKAKTIIGTLKMTFSNVNEDIHGLISPSLISLNTKNVYKIVRELQWMGQTNCPDLTYVNNLYILPHFITFKQFQNVQITAEFKSSDNEEPLQNIYGAYGSDNFVSIARSAVTYKEKKPQFFDEFKLNLPPVLTSKHHILFTFYNVGSNRDVIGYSIFPIYSPTKGIVKSDKYTLPLFQELLPNYLDLYQNDALKWIMGKQPIFVFSSKLISSIFPEDDRVIQISNELSNEIQNNDSLVSALTSLQQIPPQICMKHFPIISNILFQLLVSENENVGKEALACIAKVLRGVKTFSSEKSSHNSFILSYARYVFNNPQSQIAVYEAICNYWVQFLEEKNAIFQDLGQTWALLTIIVKSIMLKLCENGPPSPDARLHNYTKEYEENIKKLTTLLFCVPIANMDILTMVPLFMKDLLGVMNRGIVFEMIFNYISWLNNENHTGDLFLATVKFTFIKIITDYKYYIPLNMPTEIVLHEDSSSMVQNFWLEHFFSGLLIRELRAGLLLKQRIREQSISALNSLLQSHDLDFRYADPLRKQRIAGLYFPFVITTVEFHQVLEDYLAEGEKTNWLLCFFYIVKNCSRVLLRQWWGNETEQRKEKFFAMMEMGFMIFKESDLFNATCYIILDLLLEFIHLFKELLNEQNNPVLARIFQLIEKLQYNKSDVFVVCMHNLMKVIIDTLPQPLFCHKNQSYCQSLAFDILQHLNSDEQSIRSKACALFYYFLQKNFEQSKSVSRVQLQFTIAISRLVAESKLLKNNNLLTSLKIIKKFAMTQKLEFSLVADTIKQIKKLMIYSQQLQQYKDYPEVIAELYLKISNRNKDSPDVRITWLDELSRKHSNNYMWCEAALIRVLIGAMIAQYLNLTSESPVDIRSFKKIIPSIDLEMISPDLAKTLDGTSSNWSLDAFVKVIERAVLLMKQAKQYELCIELYNMLISAYKDASNYPKLIDCLTEFKLLTEVLIQTNKDLRIMWTYFRVAFYGQLFDSQEGKQYVYKFGPKENLMTIQQYFKTTLTKTYSKKEDEIEVLGNAEVDKSKLEPGKLYLQVAMVTPYIDPSEEDTRNTAFSKNFNLKSFLFESAFSDGNQQSKKRSIFHVETPFPHLLCRSEVLETTEIILSPLESAIDLIRDRISRFDIELNVPFKDVRVNQLQQLLQGSVVPMVNEGPLKICETFLSKEERGKYPKDQIKLLETLMVKFVKMCGFGIKLSNQVIYARDLAEYKQFQNMIETHYRGMQDKTSVYFNID